MTSHPAKFSQPVMDLIGELLDTHRWPKRILDPFAGVGRIHQLPLDAIDRITSPVLHARLPYTVGIEIEPEWVADSPCPRTLLANTLKLPFRAGAFDGMVTSPCLAQGERVLTNDLRWVPVGDVEVGDELLAYDETGPGNTARGAASRRRWRRAEVVRSVPKSVDCVRVILANGDEVTTTPEHPWLANRYAHATCAAEWIRSNSLIRAGRQPFFVYRQLRPWAQRTSFDAGWLSGMFDGEGSLSLGGFGAPKLCCYQVEGPVVDRVERLMSEFGYEPNRIVRKGTPEHCQKVANLYVTGGFANMLRALGELRPTRLLDKWEALDISNRTVQADKVQVVAVEPAGKCDIQEIETTEGTYFGEGYLMHNCYGNRLADHHNAQDGSIRHSYKHDIGHDLHPDNSGQLQWGTTYTSFHDAAWTECLRVLQRDALIIVNVSNHIRGGVEQLVTEWHLNWFLTHGCAVVDLGRVCTSRLRHGTNREARARFENVFTLRYMGPAAPVPQRIQLDDLQESGDDQCQFAPVWTGVPDDVDATESAGRT